MEYICHQYMHMNVTQQTFISGNIFIFLIITLVGIRSQHEIKTDYTFACLLVFQHIVWIINACYSKEKKWIMLTDRQKDFSHCFSKYTIGLDYIMVWNAHFLLNFLMNTVPEITFANSFCSTIKGCKIENKITGLVISCFNQCT